MKAFKISILAVLAALAFTTPVMAKGPRFSFSINFFDPSPRVPVVFCPPPPVPVPVPMPVRCYYPPFAIKKHVVVKEYHIYKHCDCPRCCEELNPQYRGYTQ